MRKFHRGTKKIEKNQEKSTKLPKNQEKSMKTEFPNKKILEKIEKNP